MKETEMILVGLRKVKVSIETIIVLLLTALPQLLISASFLQSSSSSLDRWFSIQPSIESQNLQQRLQNFQKRSPPVQTLATESLAETGESIGKIKSIEAIKSFDRDQFRDVPLSTKGSNGHLDDFSFDTSGLSPLGSENDSGGTGSIFSTPLSSSSDSPGNFDDRESYRESMFSYDRQYLKEPIKPNDSLNREMHPSLRSDLPSVKELVERFESPEDKRVDVTRPIKTVYRNEDGKGFSMKDMSLFKGGSRGGANGIEKGKVSSIIKNFQETHPVSRVTRMMSSPERHPDIPVVPTGYVKELASKLDPNIIKTSKNNHDLAPLEKPNFEEEQGEILSLHEENSKQQQEDNSKNSKLQKDDHKRFGFVEFFEPKESSSSSDYFSLESSNEEPEPIRIPDKVKTNSNQIEELQKEENFYDFEDLQAEEKINKNEHNEKQGNSNFFNDYYYQGESIEPKTPASNEPLKKNKKPLFKKVHFQDTQNKNDGEDLTKNGMVFKNDYNEIPEGAVEEKRFIKKVDGRNAREEEVERMGSFNENNKDGIERLESSIDHNDQLEKTKMKNYDDYSSNRRVKVLENEPMSEDHFELERNNLKGFNSLNDKNEYILKFLSKMNSNIKKTIQRRRKGKSPYRRTSHDVSDFESSKSSTEKSKSLLHFMEDSRLKASSDTHEDDNMRDLESTDNDPFRSFKSIDFYDKPSNNKSIDQKVSGFKKNSINEGSTNDANAFYPRRKVARSPVEVESPDHLSKTFDATKKILQEKKANSHPESETWAGFIQNKEIKFHLGFDEHPLKVRAGLNLNSASSYSLSCGENSIPRKEARNSQRLQKSMSVGENLKNYRMDSPDSIEVENQAQMIQKHHSMKHANSYSIISKKNLGPVRTRRDGSRNWEESPTPKSALRDKRKGGGKLKKKVSFLNEIEIFRFEDDKEENMFNNPRKRFNFLLSKIYGLRSDYLMMGLEKDETDSKPHYARKRDSINKNDLKDGTYFDLDRIEDLLSMKIKKPKTKAHLPENLRLENSDNDEDLIKKIKDSGFRRNEYKNKNNNLYLNRLRNEILPKFFGQAGIKGSLAVRLNSNKNFEELKSSHNNHKSINTNKNLKQSSKESLKYVNSRTYRNILQ